MASYGFVLRFFFQNSFYDGLTTVFCGTKLMICLSFFLFSSSHLTLCRSWCEVVLHRRGGVRRVPQRQCHFCPESQLQPAIRLAPCHSLQDTSRFKNINSVSPFDSRARWIVYSWQKAFFFFCCENIYAVFTLLFVCSQTFNWQPETK